MMLASMAEVQPKISNFVPTERHDARIDGRGAAENYRAKVGKVPPK